MTTTVKPHDIPVRSVWTELWHENPILYLAMQSTTTTNNALVSLLLLAVFSTTYDILRPYVARPARPTRNYAIIDGTFETSTTPGLLSSLARTSRGPRGTVYAKALFHVSLFVGVQYVVTLVVTQVARAIASMVTTDDHTRRECARLLAKGLECGAALRYHEFLSVAAVVGLVIVIRGLGLHIEVPLHSHRNNNSNYSPGFLSLRAKCCRILQSILAAPITVVSLHTRVPRQDLWKRVMLLLAQAALSLGIFFGGNFVCLITSLPDLQGTIDALDASGITGRKGI
ncbi:hypothetical protein BDW02DRAFT_572229 [Decorospora gaudefroyi]|uniref:Uncharacterized protein n=1 Tax=Decorospora gaudefroyi TaxID=184978 RepID=A0A6A5K986_9PLEO|nr:hypothetical protein BDW02DRAFT_572229 [Decorospora gaudefroyi]